MYKSKEEVMAFAKKAHEGQKRKSGEPYITHPIAVANIAEQLWVYWYDETFPDTTLTKVALLHDVIEDTSVTYEDIAKEFGYEIADYVLLLTKKEGDNYLQHIQRAGATLLTTVVKIADLTHNMSTLPEGTLKDKYRLAKYILQNERRF